METTKLDKDVFINFNKIAFFSFIYKKAIFIKFIVFFFIMFIYIFYEVIYTCVREERERAPT